MSNKRERFVSPKGIAVWPRLNEPDTKFNPDGDYTVALAFEGKDKEFRKLVKVLERARDERFAEWRSENPKLKKVATVAPVYVEETDENGDETGRMLLRFKMRAGGVSKRTGKPFTMKPDIFDAQNSKLETPLNIGGGSTLKVAFDLSGGYVASAKKYYLSLRLNAVQILDLVEYGARDAESYGFSTEDGYVATKPDKFPSADEDADEGYDDEDDETLEGLGPDDGDY